MSDTVNPGLENVLVAETRLSRIDGERGELLIGGFPVEDLAPNATYEECVFLLWNDRLPTAAELTDLREDLAGRRALSPESYATIRAAAEQGLPAMDAVRMGVASASLDAGEVDDPNTVARRLVAVVPTIVAAYWRYTMGEDPVDPDPDLRHAANFLYMLSGDRPDVDAVRGIETYFNAVIDHGLNASTFAGRVVVSTESDLVSAATAAVGALKGPLHGGAPGPVLDILTTVHEGEEAEAHLRNMLDEGDRLMGFGHRVYRVRDPRASVLEAAAERFYASGGDQAFFETVREVEEAGLAILAEHVADRNLATNVEFYTAALLNGVGIPRDLFTGTFAIGRVGGWTAHYLEQREDNRLIRPRGRYVGATGREWTPVGNR